MKYLVDLEIRVATPLPSSSRLRAHGLLWLVVFAVGCFASPMVRAVIPAPDGGYPNQNTAEGEDTLFTLTSGRDNTAIGFHALFNTTTGSQNTAVGVNSLSSNGRGSFNTATGFQALFSNTSGGNNSAFGFQALYSNTIGRGNTANGLDALGSNTTGNNNTAGGIFASFSNTTGNGNTANGYIALGNNITGNANTADGNFALFNNTTGDNNIALGSLAGISVTTGSNNIDIGNTGVAGDSGKIRIGTKGTQTGTFIAGIAGVAVSGTHVVVSENGRLGVVGSSARFKEKIKPMDKASEAILALQPVTFRYKEELDPNGIPQFGLIAEQVEKVNPDLVVHGNDGKLSSVRYEAVNAMLLNEFLKEHRTVNDLEQIVKKQEAIIAKQQSQIDALTESLEKVSDQLADIPVSAE